MAEVKPVRLQLSRTAGFDLQLLSTTTNGLPATMVTRPGRWGNPYAVGMTGIPDAATAVARFRNLVAGELAKNSRYLEPLRGRNLACWCKPGDPCHADVLLELANR